LDCGDSAPGRSIANSASPYPESSGRMWGSVEVRRNASQRRNAKATPARMSGPHRPAAPPSLSAEQLRCSRTEAGGMHAGRVRKCTISHVIIVAGELALSPCEAPRNRSIPPCGRRLRGPRSDRESCQERDQKHVCNFHVPSPLSWVPCLRDARQLYPNRYVASDVFSVAI
jgi:hypothetical protein